MKMQLDGMRRTNGLGARAHTAKRASNASWTGRDLEREDVQSGITHTATEQNHCYPPTLRCGMDNNILRCMSYMCWVALVFSLASSFLSVNMHIGDEIPLDAANE